MRGRRTSPKRLFALLLTVLCVAARFQGIVCPPGGRGGGGGVGEGGGEAEGGGGAGAGEGEEGGEGAGGSRSGDEEEGGSTYTYNWWGGATRAVAAGPGVDPNAAAGSQGLASVWIVFGAFVALVVSLALVARVRRAGRRRGSSKLTRSVGASCQHV